MTKIQNPKISDPNKVDRNDLLLRWGLVVSSFNYLPGTVAFYSGAKVNISSGTFVSDVSTAPELSRSNSFPYIDIRNGVVPFISIPAAVINNWLYAADSSALDLDGTDPGVSVVYPGLTLMLWMQPGNATTAFIMGKSGTGNSITNPAYGLRMSGTSIIFSVRNAADSANTIVTASSAFTAGANWYMVQARYIPSVELKLIVRGPSGAEVTATNTTSIPSAILSSNGEFRIGGGNVNWGIALPHVSAMGLPDTTFNAAFQQSRVLFGI